MGFQKKLNKVYKEQAQKKQADVQVNPQVVMSKIVNILSPFTVGQVLQILKGVEGFYMNMRLTPPADKVAEKNVNLDKKNG